MKLNMLRTLASAMTLFSSLAMAGAAEAKLKVGDAAPALKTGKWAQGEAVKSFDKDKVYIVEFWATWCGPCRATIPHLNELHEKFKDKGLVVIGQNVWERNEKQVKPFIEKMGDKMTYRVALDDKSESEDGAMAETWMKAAGQDGIPAAFVVDKQGKIAWIGHPSGLTEAIIEAVLEGKFDVKKAAEEKANEAKNQEKLMELAQDFGRQISDKNWDEAETTMDAMKKLMPKEQQEMFEAARIQILLGKGDTSAAAKVAAKVTKGSENAMMLNQVAWGLLTHEGGLKGEALETAYDIAKRADEAAKGKDAAILDTFARATFMKGDKTKAIELQEKAVKAAEDEDMKKGLQETLDSYKDGKLPKAE